jgi:hypothetical protein
VFYDPPNPYYLEYLSLDPLVLDITLNRSLFQQTGFDSFNASLPSAHQCDIINEFNSQTAKKVAFHAKFGIQQRRVPSNELSVLLQQVPTFL